MAEAKIDKLEISVQFDSNKNLVDNSVENEICSPETVKDSVDAVVVVKNCTNNAVNSEESLINENNINNFIENKMGSTETVEILNTSGLVEQHTNEEIISEELSNNVDNSVENEIRSTETAKVLTDALVLVKNHANNSAIQKELFSSAKSVSSNSCDITQDPADSFLDSLTDKFHMLNLSNNSIRDSNEVFASFSESVLNENSDCLNEAKNLNASPIFNRSADDSIASCKSDANEISFESETVPPSSNDDLISALSKTQDLSGSENYLMLSEENHTHEFQFPESDTLIEDSEKKELSFSENQPDCPEEEFQDAVTFFKDPSSFQFLENIKTSESQTNMLRDSLYIKFDPLHSQLSQLPISRAGGDTIKETPEENESFVQENNTENVMPEIINQHVASIANRESFGNILLSFDSPMKKNISKNSMSSPLGDVSRLYTEEELQKALKIHELTLLELHLKQQREMEEEKTKQNQKIEEENEMKIQAIERRHAQNIQKIETENTQKIQDIEKENVLKIQEIEKENAQKILEIEKENAQKILDMVKENAKKIQELEEENFKKVEEVEQITLKKLSEMEEELLRKEAEMSKKAHEMNETMKIKEAEMLKKINEMSETILIKEDEMIKKNIEVAAENAAIIPNMEELTKSILEKDKKLNHTSNLCIAMNEIILELKTTLVHLKEDNSALKFQNQELESTNKKLKDDLKTSSEDLQNVETTFTNFNKRYEQCKEMLKSYKENEDFCKDQIENLNKMLEEKDNMYNMLQAKSEEMLEKANFEVTNSRKAVEAQLAVLEAQLRKSELKSSSLENDLKQVKLQNEELNNMYDDLIKKVSKT